VRLIAYWDPEHGPGLGFIDWDERVVHLSTDGLNWHLLKETGLADLRRAAEPLAGTGRLARSDVDPLPAVAPGKIVCIGLNYRDHLEEQHLPMPDRPMLFGKWSNAVIADGEAIVRPEGCAALDAEVELGVVIGRQARRVSAGDAMDHVAGYVVVNDVTARDWQGNKGALHPGARGDGQWLRAKGSDTFLPLSATFVTADEIADPGHLRLRSWWVRGSGPDAGREVLMQDGTTADMLFDIPAAIEFVSRAITLEPGDVLATGTPSGVGVFRDPPVFLEPGDRVRCEVDGIGSVENPIVDWSAAAH
jgi:2-keto-4-pentenoate hydratase/2-oxohepta-3-ene-1,7-dioic acid hydratase in catechol pathway